MIKNNITFDNAAGKENVVAKVTLKTLTPNKNIINKSFTNQKDKTGSKKVVQQKANNLKYEDKENNQNFDGNKKTMKNNKTPLKNQPLQNIKKKPTT